MRRTITSLTMALLIVGGFVEPLATAVPTVHAAVPPAVVPAPAGGTISGQVTDDRGVPMPGVTVQILGSFPQPPVQTGADGRYLAAGLGDGSYQVSRIVPGGSFTPLVPYPELIRVTPSIGQTGVDFVVPRPAIVEGVVRNEAGIPIPNAFVAGLVAFQGVTAGPDGRYVASVDAGPHDIWGTAFGYIGSSGPGVPVSADVPTTHIDAVSGQAVTADLVLDAGGSISGRILDSDGLPAGGAFISASALLDPVTGRGYNVGGTADAAGFYVLRGLVPGGYTVQASGAPGPQSVGTPIVFFPGTTDVNAAQLVDVVDGATTSSIDLSLPAPVPPVTPGPPITATSISPRVVRQGTTTAATLIGSGFVPGSDITIVPFGGDNLPQVTFVEVIDSTHVAVTVTVPPDATLGAEGGLIVSQSGQNADCFCLPFVVDATSVYGSISGTVTRSSDSAPVAAVLVRAEPVDTSVALPAPVQSNADGSYQLAPLVPGDYTVRFSPNTFQSGLASEFYSDVKTDVGATPVTVVGDVDTPNIDAALDPLPTTTITSVSPSTLAPGTTTDLVVNGTGFGVDNSFQIFTSGFSQPAPTVLAKQVVSSTEVHLTVRLDPLTPSGRATILMFGNGLGLAPSCNTCITVAPGAESTGTISGAATDPLGEGLGSIRVTATPDGQADPTARTWTGADGTYALRLPAGTYTLHFEDTAGAVADVAGVVATVGQFSAGVNTTLTPLVSFGAISGTVTSSVGSPLSGALVKITNAADGTTAATITNSAGSYQFSLLSAGDYTVEFTSPGYQSRFFNDALDAASSTSVSVAGGQQVAAIDGALPLSRRPLSVVSVDTGRLVVGETVDATITGSGFAFGDVANLSLSAGDGVIITVVDASPDTTAAVSIAVDPSAALGARDLVATRDDGQQVTCVRCLRLFTALGSISGTVRVANNQALGGATVVATSVATREQFTVRTSLGGVYTFDRLPADDYTVAFPTIGYTTQWFDNAPTAATATVLTVGATPITGIDAVLQPVRGFLFIAQVSPPTVSQGSTTNATIFGSGFLNGGVTNLAFSGGPGVTIDVTGVQSDSAASVVITVATDAPIGSVLLTASRDDASTYTCTFCLQVTEPRGTISGHVAMVGAIGQFPTVTVVAAGQPFAIASAQVGLDGNYSIGNLAPGDYQVQFNAFPFPTQWWNNAPTQSGATIISVAGGETVTGIDATLTIASPQLRLDPGFFSPYEAFQGSSHSIAFSGDGFFTGVTGLAFSAGLGVSIAVDSVFTDSVANVTITADATAQLGLRDIVATRGDGQTWTCSLCLNVVQPPPGNIFGLVNDATTGFPVPATVNATRVGDNIPTATQSIFSSFFLSVPAGDYDVTVESFGYEPFSTRVTVAPGATAFLGNILLVSIRQPLTINPFTSLAAYQGFSQSYVIGGTGFKSGGVTGLSFSAGPDVTISTGIVQFDSTVSVTVTASLTAEPGVRDLTATRDDGEVAVCTGCVVVSAPPHGSLSGSVQSADSFNLIPATVTATLVGATTPAATTEAFGFFALPDLFPGDYDVLFESPGFVPTTQRITILPGQFAFTSALLELPRQPLTINSVSPSTIATGSFTQLQITGSGFRAGGVSGFTAALDPSLAIDNVFVSSDSLAFVNLAVPADAALGSYDVVLARDPGETTTCSGCVTVVKPPGFITGVVLVNGGCCASAAVTATKVGDIEPTASTFAFGFYSLTLPEGDYIIKAEAGGLVTQWWNHVSSEGEATPVPVTTGVTQFGIDFDLAPARNPLAISFLSPPEVTQGQSQSSLIFGSGFLNGGVTGLSFTAGDGVAISVDSVFDDSLVQVTISATTSAAAGPRDVVATRDDGQVATCSQCLVVLRGQPVVAKVSPSVVKEGRSTITVSGASLQRVVKVTSSSRRVVVQSFKNNANGSVSAQVKVDGGGRRSYTLTFTRDDGSTFTADFSTK